jgi:hypothetical protein
MSSVEVARDPSPCRRAPVRTGLLPRSFALGLVLLYASVPAVRADDWAAWQGGSARAGASAEIIAPPLEPAWSVQLPGHLHAAPVVVEGRCYAATDTGRLLCLNAEDGRTLWTFDADGAIEGTPAVDAGVVYAGTLAGALYALRADTGSVLWSVRHGGAQESAPLILRDRVVVAVGRPARTLHAYATSTGTLLWSFAARQPIHSAGTRCRYGGRDAIVAGDAGGVWSVIDSAAGPGAGNRPHWSFWLPTPQRVPAAAAAGGGDRVVIAPGGTDLRIFVMDLDRRKTLRRVAAAPPAETDGEAADDFAELLQLPVEGLEALFPEGLVAVDGNLDAAELLLGRPLDALRDALGGAGDSNAEAFPPIVAGRRIFVLRRERSANEDALVLVRADLETGGIDSCAVLRAPASGAEDRNVFYRGWRGPSSAPVATFERTDAAAAGTVGGLTLAGRYLYLAAGGDLIAFDAEDLALGPAFRVGLPSAGASAPAAADGRVIVADGAGGLHAFAGANHPPRLPASLEPTGGANVRNHFPTLRWPGAADPDASDPPEKLATVLEYAAARGGAAGDGVPPDAWVRLELPPGVTDHTIGTFLPANTRVAWRVRIRDAAGAASPWSELQTFVVHYDPDPPDPPHGLAVLAYDSAVQLTWAASPSPDVIGYNVYCKRGTLGFAQAEVIRLGHVTSASIGRLANGDSYDFMVTAVDGAGNESAGVVVAAAPRPDIAVDGTSGFPTIQEAIDAAAPGDVVALGPKTFRVAGGLVLKPGVSLRGTAPHLTILDGAGAPAVLRIDGTTSDGRVAVDSLTVTGGDAGIDTGNADVLLRNLQVVRLAGPGIMTGPLGAVEGVSLTVSDNAGDGLAVQTPIASFRGLILCQNDGYGATGVPGTGVTYSTLFGNALGSAAGFALDPPAAVVPTGNRADPVTFRDPAVFDYRVKAGDPAVDAGHPDDPFDLEPEPNGKRINQGAFGNTPYAERSTAAPATLAAPGDPATPEVDKPDGSGMCFAASAGGGPAGPTAVAVAIGIALMAFIARRPTARPVFRRGEAVYAARRSRN